MSRMIWGRGDAPRSDGMRQPRLDGFAVPVAAPQAAQRRARDDDGASVEAGEQHARPLQPKAELETADRPPDMDGGIIYGPSGGSNRETQGRGRPRAFMNGGERREVFDQSPYARGFVDAWREERASAAGPSAQRSDLTTTAMDDVVVRHYAAPDCPRNLFAGQVFFLNSCDSDPLISVFHLEKLIRYLGGSTAMGVSKRVAYVVTQHLSFAKEEKVRAAMSRGASRGLPYKLVHPHFILDSAKAGKLLPIAPYLTHVAAEKPRAMQQPEAVAAPPAASVARLARAASSPNVSKPVRMTALGQQASQRSTAAGKPPAVTEVIEID